MDEKIANKLQIFPDQLVSLTKLVPLLSKNRVSILYALIQFIESGSLISDATQNQINESTNIPYRTISRCIKEFETAGLLYSWRGPTGQCHHKFLLPVRESVFEYYQSRNKKSITGRPRTVESTVSVSNTVTVADEEQIIVKPESLDPEISSRLDILEEKQVRNGTVNFLVSIGIVPEIDDPGDTGFEIDRTGLFRFLQERNANSLLAFGELVKAFSKLPTGLSPEIDLPMSTRLLSHIELNLHYFQIGQMWLLKNIHWQDENGRTISDENLRINMLDFIIKNQLSTLGDAFRMAIRHDVKIKKEREVEHKGLAKGTEGKSQRKQGVTEDAFGFFKKDPVAWMRTLHSGSSDENEDEYLPASRLML